MQASALNLLITSSILILATGCFGLEVMWGLRNDEVEMGIRFEKVDFFRNEPVEAEVILRNLGDSTRHLPRFNNGADAYRLVVFRNGQRLALPPRAFSVSGEVSLESGGALTNRIRLDQRLGSLEPGNYVVSAEYSVPPAGKTNLTTLPEQVQVRSGEAAFRLVESTNPSPALAFSSAAPGRYPVPGGTPQASMAPGDSKASAGNRVAPPNTTSSNEQSPWDGQRKTALGIITALAVLLLAVFWRAARRGRNT